MFLVQLICEVEGVVGSEVSDKTQAVKDHLDKEVEMLKCLHERKTKCNVHQTEYKLFQ